MERENVANSRRKLHVVILPYLAYGHVNPMVELAKGLSALGVQVSFVSTPMYIDKIRDRFSQGEIQLVELALPEVKGLAPGQEGTTHLPTHMIPLLKKAVAAMEKPFEALVHRLSPDCVIYDVSMGWRGASIKSGLNVPVVLFISCSLATIAYYVEAGGNMKSDEITADGLLRPPPRFPSSRLFLRPFEASRTVDLFKSDNVTATTLQRLPIFFNTCADAIVANSCEAMEKKFISYVQTLTGTSLFPVGPLIPSSLPPPNGSEGPDNCIRWLERQAPSSVVFVSLGSECFPSKDEVHAIALGLEASQHPFLWVLRFPKYSEEDYSSSAQILDTSSSLPPGFESRTRDRGLVVEGWANQMQILSHPSTGAFMTHCGWNSSVEGMRAGIPLIAMPIQYEQPLNARLIVGELGVGLDVERGSDGSFSEKQIQEAVTNAMSHDSPVRHNAKLLGETIQENVFGIHGSRQKFLLEFVQKLKQIAAFNA